MGMTGGLVRASEADIARLRAERSSLPRFIEGDAWAPPVRRVQPKGVLGWLLKLTPITLEEVDPDAVPPPGATLVDSDAHLDLDKAWLPLHFLLTGTAGEGEEPACYLVKGGEELADEDDDLGYSLIRALTPHQVRRFSEFLGPLTHDALRQRFDIERMVTLDIYRVSRGRAVSQDVEMPYLLEAFDALQSFAARTAERNDGAIAFLT